MAKQRIVHVSIHRSRTKKLRMVKNVERFQAELQRLRLTNLEVSQQRQVRVERPGPGKISPARIAGSAQGIVGKSPRIEILQRAIAVRIGDAQGSTRFVREVQIPIVDAIRAAALQGII